MISRVEERGFSLIEIIVTLLMVAVLTSLSLVGVTRLVQGFFFAAGNASMAQKAQNAMLRINRELNSLSDNGTTVATNRSITFTSHRGGVEGNHVLSWDGTGSHALLLDNDPLLGGAANDTISFALSYFNSYDDGTAKTAWSSNIRVIQIEVGIQGPDNTMHTFIQRVRPRNL
jgi:prepilin-type N-terminal cleavage/methylation domain-containing protein